MLRLLPALLTGLWAVTAAAAPIKVGDLGILSDAPFYIAIEKGYFAAEKLDVTLQRFDSAVQATSPLATNDIQVIGGGVGVTLYNAFAHDWPVRIAMGRTRDLPGFSSDAIVVRDDLKATLTSAKALKGRLVGINALGSVMHFMLGRFMESEGLTINDVQTLNMDWPNMAPGMTTHAIDAAMVAEPFVTELRKRNISIPLRRAADFMTQPPLEASVLLYSKTWTDKNPDEAKAFSVAYLKGVRDYVDAMRGGAKRAEVVAICAKYTSLKDKAAYDKMQWTYMDANAEVSIAGLKDQQDWYIKQGFMARRSNVEAMIDRRFLDYALEKLGRVDDK